MAAHAGSVSGDAAGGPGGARPAGPQPGIVPGSSPVATGIPLRVQSL